MHNSSVFLVSTPLHLLVSIAIVSEENIKNAHLIFIDQVEGKSNPYLDTLLQWSNNPFQSIEVFYRSQRALSNKLKARKNTFKHLKLLAEKLAPNHVYCGNDRRIEFQYMMHVATKMGFHPKGYYMDEGTFTYVGRKASDSFSDKVLDNAVKKLAYGFWWKHPATVGASDWIQTAYVSFPAIVHPLLQVKKLRQLTLEYWQNKQLIDFCHLLVSVIGKPNNLEDVDLLITLPHESILQANADYRDQIHQLIDEALQNQLKVAVKYHPRDTFDDALNVASMGAVDIFSRQLPFEALLPMIKSGAVVLGDFSSTLISTRLLRPDLTVKAIDQGNQQQSESFIDLYKKIGITIIKCKNRK